MSPSISRERRKNYVLREAINALVCAQVRSDQRTGLHARRTAELGIEIGTRLGLPAAALRTLRLAALVHDIGKLAIPTAITNKPGTLTEDEFAVMQTHCEIGRDILMKLRSGRRVAEIVYQHHERMDGSGYPCGLKNGSISVKARILAVADTFDALTSDRPYRAALGAELALTELQKLAWHKLDGDAVAACKDFVLHPKRLRRAAQRSARRAVALQG